jgi:Zn finger protein HypA/HybF involved in hydrogenase expression
MVWSLLFGPVGVIVVLCLPNLAKKEEDAKAQHLLQSQVQLQQAQLRELQALVTAVAARPAAETPTAAPPEVVYNKTTCPGCGTRIEHTAFNGWVDCPQCRQRVDLAIVDGDGEGGAAG